MRHFANATVGLCLAAAGAAWAGDGTSQPVVVVELYTSQGCSSCPPADEFLGALVGDPQVIPLALHVDYWDYIGWKDVFADPKFTDRQKAYARAVSSRSIYTPQLIVGGLDRVEGNQPAAVKALIRKHLDGAHGVTLTLAREGGQLLIRAETKAPLEGPLRVQLVRYRPQETIDIERGENAGLTMTYHNIVTSWQSLGDWTGEAPLAIEAEVAGSEPAVVILQSAGPAMIVAAARID